MKSESRKVVRGDVSRKPFTGKTCEHKRIINDVLTERGQKTGQTVCAECGTILPATVQDTTLAGSS